MRTLATVASLFLALGCGGGGEGGGTGGSGGTAWSGGPSGHVYVYAGPLYDIDARDGRILRRITLDRGASGLQATSMAVYFKKFNAAGMARVYSIGLGSDALTEVIAQSANLRTVGGGRVLGDRNSSVLVVYNPATNTAAEIPVPLGLQCEGRSASDTAYYLVCVRTTVAGTDVGLVAFDLGTMQFSPFVVVKSRVGAISFTSNATYTPAGILFGLYEGGASRGTRTAYRIDPGTMAVSAGVAVPGVSDDLDEQVAIGGKVYLTMYPANQVVPVDVATLAAGGPIAVAKPRHIVAGGAAGGGALFVVTNAGTDDALAKVDPASGAMALRTFPPLEASKIDSMAFSPP